MKTQFLIFSQEENHEFVSKMLSAFTRWYSNPFRTCNSAEDIISTGGTEYVVFYADILKSCIRCRILEI